VKNSASTGSLGDASAGLAHLVSQSVYRVGSVDDDADGEADAAGDRLGLGVAAAGKLMIDGKRGENTPCRSNAATRRRR
jgi:hypothetical protein